VLVGLDKQSWFHGGQIHDRKPAQVSAMEGNNIPDPIKIVTYKITQEALNNIAKHSKADLIKFSLRKTGKIELFIRDNSRGFNLDEKPSLEGTKQRIGLSSMRERVELSGGSF